LTFVGDEEKKSFKNIFQYTPDERFGQTASNCQLSTPKDASCTHILVFPTSAKAQVLADSRI
jgi:hypothetical protein